MIYNAYMKSKLNKKLTSIRMTDEARRLVELLAEKYGMTNSAIIELAVREYAEKREIK